MELHVFDGLSGAHVRRLKAASCAWSDSVNEVGSLTATIVDDGVDPSSHLRPFGSIVAVVDGAAVRHAGYLTEWRRNRSSGTYELTVGGGATILSKRLVLNHALSSAWRDGAVLIDDDNPPGNWVLAANGSYSDLIRALIVETEKWGTLPITPAAATGGEKTRTWQCWDLATVLDRIQDIGDLEKGPEWRFDPVLSSSWSLTFQQVTSADGGEIVNHEWHWNATIPASGVLLGDEDADGADMATACYAVGGKDEDKTLVAHASASALTARGWPVLQVADKSHSQVSVLSTLQAYARGTVAAGDQAQDTVEVTVPMALDVRVGDHADVRHGPGEDDVLHLKVTDVKGSFGSPTQTLGCRAR